MFYLKRKIVIKKRDRGRGTKAESRTVMLGQFRKIEHARHVMQLMTDYKAGYGLYVHIPREEGMAYLLRSQAEREKKEVENNG